VPIITGGGSGSGSGGLTPLFSSVLVGTAASIDSGAGGFATTSNVLMVFMLLRTNNAAGSDDVQLRLNNDSGANYDYENVQVANASLSGNPSAAATGVNLHITGNTAAAGVASPITAFLPAYGGTTFNKTGNVIIGIPAQAAAGDFLETKTFEWRNTAAVTRVSVGSGTGSFLAGSAMYVYGI
jgi:hypothetical protein